MVVSALTGHGDSELLDILPATTTPDRIALVGMHDWTDPTLPAIAEEWGLTVFAPKYCGPPAHRSWTGSTTPEPPRWSSTSTSTPPTRTKSSWASAPTLVASPVPKHALVAEIDAHADVVSLTIAEYIPRQVMHLQHLLAGFPLL